MDAIELRLSRLETANRRMRLLCAASLAVPGLAVIGWNSGTSDLVRTRRLEVVDARGVPLVVLEPTRRGEGGSLTLRDQDGERRAWFTSGPTESNLGMVSGKVDEPSASVGFHVSPQDARVIISGKSANSRTSVANDRPTIELTDGAGRRIFSAPWRP